MSTSAAASIEALDEHGTDLLLEEIELVRSQFDVGGKDGNGCCKNEEEAGNRRE